VVSCSYIGAQLGFDPTQVRKDLAVTGVTGRPKVGYEVPALIDAIESFLGWNNLRQAFLVGVGSLGAALLGYDRFNRYGLSIVAAFDSDPQKIDQEIHGKPIVAMEKLADLAQRMHVHLGILTVPAEAAQECADAMIRGGIRAIWNFAPITLDTPDDVIVQNEDMFASLAVLSSKLAEQSATQEVH
jgi:redox-sensing transcriptional repressor